MLSFKNTRSIFFYSFYKGYYKYYLTSQFIYINYYIYKKKVLIIVIIIISNILNLEFIKFFKLVVLKDVNGMLLDSKVIKNIAWIASDISANV